jgi:signal transduction histidine kinase/CheY-like chemotaxis protein
VATALLAGVAYVPGVLAAAGADLWSVVVVDTVAWALVIVMAVFRTRIPYGVRAGFFISAWYLLAVFLLLQVGPVGGGAVWLASFPVLTSIFFRLRGTLGALALTLAAVLGVGITIFTAPPGPILGLGVMDYDLASWIATAGGILFIGALLSLGIAYLVRGLEEALERTSQARLELALANGRLEGEIEERRRLESRLVQAGKMEALGTLAGGIAHDFNNLLVPILMGTREMQDRAPAGSAQREELGRIVQSARRARELVRRILAFSRGEEVERTLCRVEPIIREVGLLLRSSLPPHVDLRYQLEAPLAEVRANPSELHQVLMNLATNAYLAMEGKGGTLTLASRWASEREGKSRPHLLITVQDTGAGMDPEVMERALDPFFTTRAPGEGTGLGLATAHGIVQSLGGEILLDSQPGKGTQVTLRLPATAAEQETTSSSPGGSEKAESPPSGAYILLVDDEEMVRRTTRLILERLGYRVVEVESPVRALEVIEEGRPLDLVVTDFAMPGMNGTELAERILRSRPDLPIVLSSGYLDQRTLDKARSLGLAGVLQKPYERERLSSVVEEALASAGSGS